MNVNLSSIYNMFRLCLHLVVILHQCCFSSFTVYYVKMLFILFSKCLMMKKQQKKWLNGLQEFCSFFFFYPELELPDINFPRGSIKFLVFYLSKGFVLVFCLMIIHDCNTCTDLVPCVKKNAFISILY